MVQMLGWLSADAAFAFRCKRSKDLGISGDFVGKEFQGDEAVKASVLGFVDHSHPAAAKLLGDAVVRDGLTNHSRDGRLLSRFILPTRVRRVNEWGMVDSVASASCFHQRKFRTLPGWSECVEPEHCSI